MARLNYNLSEGSSITEAITFDDFGFIDDVVIDWDVTSVTYGGDAIQGLDYTISSSLNETNLSITFSALSDTISDPGEIAEISVVGYIDWIGPPGTNGNPGSFLQNLNGDLVFGVEIREPISGTISFSIQDVHEDDVLPQEIRDLYFSSIVLSTESQTLIDLALQTAYDEFPNAEIGEVIEQAFLDLIAQRNEPGNSTNLDLRDAEYYLYGLYASSNGDILQGILVAGAPAYNGLKGLANAFGARDVLRSDPGNPNAPPGGSLAAYEGLLDGNAVVTQQIFEKPNAPFLAPFTESNIWTDDFMF